MAIAERELKTKQAEILSSPEAQDDEWTLEEYLEERGVVLPTHLGTFEEYLKWGLENNVRAEWINGKIEARMSASRWHQEIRCRVLRSMSRFCVSGPCRRRTF